MTDLSRAEKTDVRLIALRLSATGRPKITAAIDAVEDELHTLRARVEQLENAGQALLNQFDLYGEIDDSDPTVRRFRAVLDGRGADSHQP